MKIKTFRGQIPMGLEIKIHLSTNDGLTGYRINKFQLISNAPGANDNEFVGKIKTKADPNIDATVDFNDSDLLAVVYLKEGAGVNQGVNDVIIFDNETFNQDAFVNITDASGGTTPCNFYLELEQFKIDLNTSTFHTLKNIRSRTQVGI
tara:strand:- start:14 stop:460 length:447 start_codon:yes stop_codon:yes gene_type:complete